MDGIGKGTKYTEIRKLTDNPFLNLFEMDALDNKGKPFHYYFASRNREEELPLKTGEVRQTRIVMIRQYRYPLDAWLYELPAGLIDGQESPHQAAVREMKEETGLGFEPCTDLDPAYERPFFLGAGLTDETSTSVFGYASGEVSRSYAESTESIEVLFVNRQEAGEILRTKRVSLRAALLLTMFINAEDEEPFGFLK